MIKTARQLKDLIRNLSKDKSADAQILMRNYMMERFLERISLSEYRDKFILKGGMLVAAMVGLDARSTMDIDATVKGATVGIEDVENMIASIISVPVDDGVGFRVKRISEIMDEAEYPGIRVSMETEFDGVITPLKIDISTGDAITPREVRYSFKLMLEDRSIEIWAYNLETVLAEKLETVVSRATTNTRMRDFYDLHILSQLHGQSIVPADLRAGGCFCFMMNQIMTESRYYITLNIFITCGTTESCITFFKACRNGNFAIRNDIMNGKSYGLTHKSNRRIFAGRLIFCAICRTTFKRSAYFSFAADRLSLKLNVEEFARCV